MTKHICEYGCGNEATYQIGKNKRWCCSEKWQWCPEIRKKIGNGNKGNVLSIEHRIKISVLQKGKKKNCLAKKISNDEGIICDYGCNTKANYIFDNKQYCCSKSHNSCPGNIEKRRKILTGMTIQNEESRKKISKALKGRKHTEEHKRKNSEAQKGKKQSEETKRKRSESMKGKSNGPLSEEQKKKISKTHKYSIEKWQEKCPILVKVEDMRYHPKTGEIQVHCKNHNCKNSKEKGGWFTPLRTQISERIRVLNINDGCYFYCCEECKQECSLFNIHGDPVTKKEIPYTDQEYNIWRQEVLTRQLNELGHNECEICGNKNLKELQVHHEIPVKKNWIFSLDPDNGIILCVKKERQKEEETCHYKYGHKTGTSCSTGNLAHTICI
jgi:hypothetical protein